MTANALIAAGHTGLASAIHKYIGSFERARRLAKIPSPGRLSPSTIETWDEQTVIDVITQRRRDGESLAYKQVPTKLVDAALYYCGSWKNAIEMAGLDYAEIRRSSPAWSRADIIAGLRQAAHSGRKGVGADGAMHEALYLAATRTFGSVYEALRAARVDPARVLVRVQLDDDELGQAVRRLVREHPTMTLGDIQSAPLGRRVLRRFGSIDAGMRALGIRWKPQPPRRRSSRK